MSGRHCRLERLDADAHAEQLWRAFSLDRDSRDWTYLPYGPFDSAAALRAWIEADCLGEDPCFFSVIDLASGEALGVASFLRIDPRGGVIEVGHIHFSPAMQRRPIGTEAMYLMMRLVFEQLGYRRYEWKCNAQNAPSCRAARRLGFHHEGVFRQAAIVKGRNRDTAWFSMLDREWPMAKAAFEAWLDEANFDAAGNQRTSLSAGMRAAFTETR